MAITPLAYPTIVTPYGIAALIVLMALAPGLEARLLIGVALTALMLVDFVVMLLAQHILQLLGVFLQILGSVLAIIQVALALQIILSSLPGAFRAVGS